MFRWCLRWDDDDDTIAFNLEIIVGKKYNKMFVISIGNYVDAHLSGGGKNKWVIEGE